MSTISQRPIPVSRQIVGVTSVSTAHRKQVPLGVPVHERPPIRRVQPTSKSLAVLTGRNIGIMCVAFVAIMLCRLFVSVATDANAYEIASLAKESQNLTRDAQHIQEQLDVLNSPQYLSNVAQSLGMMSNPSPAYLRISDGKVWGDPVVVSSGLIDKTHIANDLVSELGVKSLTKGVASRQAPPSAPHSNSRSVVNSEPSGIPAPDTH